MLQPTQASLVSTAFFKLSPPRPLDLPPARHLSPKPPAGPPPRPPSPSSHLTGPSRQKNTCKKACQDPCHRGCKTKWERSHATRLMRLPVLCCGLCSAPFSRQNEPF
ncbi:hypothetical protein V8C44DRAFT_326170 [Trichoderma aethiopicum]